MCTSRYESKSGYDSKYQEMVQENKYKKGKYKVGQLIRSEEKLDNNVYKVVQVIDKKIYNMYVAENLKFNWKITITDKEDYEIVEE